MINDDEARKIIIVSEYENDGKHLSSYEILRWLRGQGVKVLSLSTELCCKACKGRGFVDDGALYPDSACIRRSKPCPTCDGKGRPKRFQAVSTGAGQ